MAAGTRSRRCGGSSRPGSSRTLARYTGDFAAGRGPRPGGAGRGARHLAPRRRAAQPGRVAADGGTAAGRSTRSAGASALDDAVRRPRPRPGRGRCRGGRHVGGRRRAGRRGPGRPTCCGTPTGSTTTCWRWCSSPATRCCRREAQVALTLRVRRRPHQRRDRPGLPRADRHGAGADHPGEEDAVGGAGALRGARRRTSAAERLGSVLSVVYVIFTEGSTATSGDDLIRPDLADEAVRLARVLAGLVPDEPEVHGLLALLELTAARFPARTAGPTASRCCSRSRTGGAGTGRRSGAAGRRSPPRVGSVAGSAPTASRRRSPSATRSPRRSRRPTGTGSSCSTRRSVGWRRRPSSSSTGRWRSRWPRDRPRACGSSTTSSRPGQLAGSHLLPSVRGELLGRVGDVDGARRELERALGLCENERERGVLRRRLAALPASS